MKTRITMVQEVESRERKKQPRRRSLRGGSKGETLGVEVRALKHECERSEAKSSKHKLLLREAKQKAKARARRTTSRGAKHTRLESGDQEPSARIMLSGQAVTYSTENEGEKEEILGTRNTCDWFSLNNYACVSNVRHNMRTPEEVLSDWKIYGGKTNLVPSAALGML